MAADIEDADNTASVASAGGVGTLLRETRERQGRDVAGVATSLRIRQPYLQAIEDGRFEDLPGATYAVGFVRGYAEFLGLDSSEIVRRFKQENAEFANRAELVFPSAVSEASIPTGALLLFAIIAAAAAYGFWYWYQNREASVADAVPPLPERLAALIHRPVGSGSEMVPVSPADGGKPADSAPATAAAPIVPPVAPTAPSVASSSPQAAAPGSAPHEDVVPPPEDDTSNAAPAPAPTAVAPAAPPPAAPPVAMAPGDAKPADSKEAKAAATKPGKPGKGKEQPAAESAKPSAAPVPPAAEPAAAPSPMPAPPRPRRPRSVAPPIRPRRRPAPAAMRGWCCGPRKIAGFRSAIRAVKWSVPGCCAKVKAIRCRVAPGCR